MLKEFEAVGKRLEADFDMTEAHTHQGVKGQSRESLLVRDFLRPYLPKRFAIGSGQIIDSTGHVSKQQDIVVFDDMNYPVLQDNQETKLFFSEQVLAVIEVKSTLDMRAIKDMIEKSTNMASLVRRSSGPIYIAPNFVFESSSVPVVTLGFAYTSTLSLEGIRQRLESQIAAQGRFDGPSAIMVLADKTRKPGLVAGIDRRNIGRLTVVPESTTVIAQIETSTRGEALLYFYLALMDRIKREGLVAPEPDYAVYAKTAGLTDPSIGLSQQSLQGSRFFWEDKPVEVDDVTRLQELLMKMNKPVPISDDEIVEIFVRSTRLPNIDSGFRSGTIFAVNNTPLESRISPRVVGIALDHLSMNQLTDQDEAALSMFVDLIRRIRKSSDLIQIVDTQDGARLFSWKGPNILDSNGDTV